MKLYQRMEADLAEMDDPQECGNKPRWRQKPLKRNLKNRRRRPLKDDHRALRDM